MFTRAECLKHVGDVLGDLYCDIVCLRLMWALIAFGAVMQTFSVLKLSWMLLKGNKVGCLTILNGLGLWSLSLSRLYINMLKQNRIKGYLGFTVRHFKSLLLFRSLLQTFRFITKCNAARHSRWLGVGRKKETQNNWSKGVDLSIA